MGARGAIAGSGASCDGGFEGDYGASGTDIVVDSMAEMIAGGTCTDGRCPRY